MGISNRVRITPVLLALALVGCGDDATSVSVKCGLLGKANVSIAGAVTAAVNSCAGYTVTTGGSPVTAVSLFAGSVSEPTHTITLGRNGARPAQGDYTVGAAAGNFSGTFKLEGGTAADRNFVLTGGTINISASSTGTLNGSFTSVTAAEVGTPANTITLSGTFSAKCIDTADTDC